MNVASRISLVFFITGMVVASSPAFPDLRLGASILFVAMGTLFIITGEQ